MKHKEDGHEEVEDVIDREHLDQLKQIAKDDNDDAKNDNLWSLNNRRITNPSWKHSRSCIHPGGAEYHKSCITNQLRHT